jgi:glycosyltransferase involved in cell wall biosynthesis
MTEVGLTTAATPLVSCVVPVYNGQRFLADAILSILQQSYSAREIIVVDDGSTDGTPDVIATFGSRIRAIRQDNLGPSAARNAGVEIATGSFLAFLDADDLWHADKLTRQMARFEERPDLEVSFANFRNVRGMEPVAGDPLLDPEAWPVSPFSPCTLVGRRSAFDRVGAFDPKLRRSEDTEWFVRMMHKGIRYEVMPDVLVDRRIHDANLSRKEIPSPKSVLMALKQVLDRRRSEGW